MVESLLAAVRGNDQAGLRKLLAGGAKPDARDPGFETTAVHAAVYQGDAGIPCLRVLLAAGASANGSAVNGPKRLLVATQNACPCELSIGLNLGRLHLGMLRVLSESKCVPRHHSVDAGLYPRPDRWASQTAAALRCRRERSHKEGPACCRLRNPARPAGACAASPNFCRGHIPAAGPAIQKNERVATRLLLEAAKERCGVVGQNL